MNCGNVINFMNQQLRAIKNLEELVEHDEKHHSSNIPREKVETLKAYIIDMKTACATAIALAKHYEAEEKAEAKTISEQPEQSKPEKVKVTKNKKGSTKKPETPKEEPPEDAVEFDFLE